MSKPKLNFENAVISVDGEEFVVTEKDEQGELLGIHSLNDELKKFNGTEHLKLSIKVVGKKSERKQRKPNFKYTCKCGNTIVSKSDELEIQCLVCGEQFEKEEEK